MTVKIRKWGNSLGIRLPKAIMQENNITDGSEVDITTKDGVIILKPVQKKKYELKDLLDGVSEVNIHNEIKTGDATGKESW